MNKPRSILLWLIGLLFLSVAIVSAQGSGPEMPRWVIGGGGGVATGGDVAISGAIGQAIAGSAPGGNVALGGGFWTGGAAALVEKQFIYLPLVLRNWPPAPPILTISAADQDGNYIISWTYTGADSYILQEATDATFAGALQVYNGAATSFNAVGKGPTRYYYRIRGIHGAYTTLWSAAQTVDVVWEKENNNTMQTANGPLVSGLTYYGYFNDTDDYFKIEVTQAGIVAVTAQGTGGSQAIALKDALGAIICYAYQLSCPVSQAGQYYIDVYSRADPPPNTQYSIGITYP